METNLIHRSKRIGLLTFWLSLCVGCDLLNKRDCQWYLVPEPKHKDMVEPGWVSACVRNYKINRQKCLLKIKIEEMERIEGRPFRLVDLEIDKKKIPREVVSVKLCEKG